MNTILFLVPILVLLSQLGVSAVRINTKGGYNITIAVKENIQEPKNVTSFLNNIRAIVQDFSSQLHIASRKKFYIHSADILIPATWATNSSAAKSVSYKTADIRIFSEFLPENFPQSPRVENPNTCGTAGTHMEIPLSFFDNPDFGLYGKPGKALTNLWARYRFGVWEEHGYPDDSQFPYLYQKPSLNIKWSPTGCSDTELSGNFINSNGEKCALDVDKQPEQDCKFEPSLTNNTAVSSLLHFPWINSVTQFCDLRTHNYAAPNRQNFLCGHRSVWDVIRETADYKQVSDDPMENIPQVLIDIVKVSPEPLFYILVDVGKTSYPESVIKEITTSLTSIFTDAGDNNLNNIVTSIGSFPTNSQEEKSGSYVNENVPWSSIATSKQKFIQALDELSVSDGPLVRDFAAALQETIELIKLRNHTAGAVIVVLKKGATPNYFDRITYEQDVIASVHGLTNIKLMAIELQENNVIPYVNLVNIVKETNGTLLRISDDTNIGEKLDQFVESVKNALKKPISPTRKFRIVTKQTTRAGGAKIEIPVLENDFISLQVHLTTSGYIRSGNVEFIQLAGDEQSFEVEENGEWGENVDAEKRYVHTMIIQRPMKGSVWSVGHTCMSENVTDCSGYLVVYGEIENSDKSLSVSDTVDITVSTSADDGYVDMSLQGPNVPKVVPFAIHAKIEIDGQPILHLSNVNAVIRLSDKSQSWKIPLQDTGNGISDISSKDGIYSNIFTPLVDGFYSVSVVVEHNISHDSSKVHGHNKASGVGRLIPVSQDVIGCYNSVSSTCYGAKLTDSFSKVTDLPGRVFVANSIAFFPGKPVKITDFKVSVQPNFRVIFSFTAPELLGSNDSPEEFQIFMAPSPNNYLGSTNLTYNIVRQIGSPPGTYLEIPYYTVQTSLPYYGVEAIYKNIRSGPSNIVGINTERPTQSETEYKDKTSQLTNTATNNNNSIDMKKEVVQTAGSSSRLTATDITKIAIGISITCLVLAVIVVIYRCRQSRLRGKGSFGSTQAIKA